ncbi:UvrD-helicase domain-containing protein [Gephyromycinifex aptenodytis]|uniref:UvrD-helicase domain-containing protein n=1 Tax=Gephyromycinifex aptenodytis TaxID=2716227 RepID=UPI001D00C9B1|nr:UvrD-helicase domain-containing protein [Gephyromycinifex aptenodytis]
MSNSRLQPTTERIDTFDIADPLPTGTTLLEASAGTGKTWTIGALVTRYVAEGHARLEEMLTVTFGRAASQELRERVRESVVRAARALAHPETVTPGQDALLDVLLDADQQELQVRRGRLLQALTSFDAVTIATTHQFCQMVLRSLGVAGDTDRDARLVEDVDDLLVEVVDDLYLRGFARSQDAPVFNRAEALRIARAVIGDPQAQIEPSHLERTTPAGRRVSFAHAVRDEMSRRMRRLGLLGYDDLLSRLAQALADEDAPARARMRQRWPVVLVDEFQDTDPVQWQVLDRAFSGHSTMVLIGDPKQAIYAFRGGDVVTYLQAAATATTVKTLGVNYRSDHGLLTGVQAVLGGAELGDERIVVRDVSAVHTNRLQGAPHPEPFRLRVLDHEAAGWKPGSTMWISKVRPKIAADLACDIQELLAADTRFAGRKLLPADIAVLAHTSRQLAQVKDALHAAGIPAVVASTGSVFRTPAAAAWRSVLEAMEQPHRTARVQAAALSPLIGHTAEELAEHGERLTDEVAFTMRRWGQVIAERGVAAVLEAATEAGLPQRLLARQDGERELTDLRHVAEILHEEAATDRLGLLALLTRLIEHMREDAHEGPNVRRRRLDSDAAAVQLSTIHGSKGLQYPVVYLPYLADRWVNDEGPSIPRFHTTPRTAGEQPVRAVDVGGSYAGRRDSVAAHHSEEAGESLRLLYVALTRAQSQVITWWAPTNNTEPSALHRVLFGRRPGQGAVPPVTPIPEDEQARAILAAWQEHGGPVVERVEPRPLTPQPAPATDAQFARRHFTRALDLAWRRTSYSALTNVEISAPTLPDGVSADSWAGQALVGSEPEGVGTDDEASLAMPAVSPADGPQAEVGPLSPMSDLPLGATFGSLVHAVLEEADPHAADLQAEFRTRIEEQQRLWPVELDADVLAEALVAVADTPLGPLAPGATLRGIGRADRLCELEFEMPLAGGDRGVTRDVELGEVADLLRRHLEPGDPLLPYADQLAHPELGGQHLRGYLTGSIDVVLRYNGRFLVADYKTNWLGPMDEPLHVSAYAPEPLAQAMGHSDYPLQALLYAVVLHRYLRWRLPDYEPEQHLGGILYLYVRGMAGPDTPLEGGHPYGVFSWRPPVDLVRDLSDLLDGGVMDKAGE